MSESDSRKLYRIDGADFPFSSLERHKRVIDALSPYTEEELQQNRIEHEEWAEKWEKMTQEWMANPNRIIIEPVGLTPQEKADAYPIALDELETDMVWFQQGHAENFMDGADPQTATVRIIQGHMWSNYVVGPIVHHRYVVEIREAGILRAKIEAVFGVSFDHVRVKAIPVEELETEEFVAYIAKHRLINETWPRMHEYVIQMLHQFGWSEEGLDLNISGDDFRYPTWDYDTNVALFMR